jgi:DNA modification methylase
MTDAARILVGDVMDGLAQIADGSVHCCVTSPPYYALRDYGIEGQIGLESTPAEYVARMVDVFREVRRVLRDDGVCFLNLGDSYNAYNGNRGASSGLSAPTNDEAPPLPGGHGLTAKGMKPKDLMMMPWRVAIALQDDGWWIRSVIVWAKKSPMPESATDRPTSSWEPIFLLAKNARYYYDAEAVKEPMSEAAEKRQSYGRKNQWGHIIDANQHADSRSHEDAKSYGADDAPASRNQRNVWHLGPEPYKEAHFATYPSEIPRRAIKAGTSEKGCCPTCGAPWSRIVSKTQVIRERPNDYTKRNGADGTGNSCANSVAGVESRTIGWEPTCKCPLHVPVPCMVLDPFLGSGTTVAVARELGRHGVGCELNPEYAAMARVRIGEAERPSTFRDESRVDDESTLFALKHNTPQGEEQING